MTEDDFIAVVRAEIPAGVDWELFVGDTMVFPKDRPAPQVRATGVAPAAPASPGA
jgi:hypothetical protein